MAPFSTTVDDQAMEDDTVTIRDRDTMEQDRIPAENIQHYIADRIEQWTPEA